MEFQYFGANCVSAISKNARIIIDDNLSELGAKSVSKDEDVVLFTNGHDNPKVKAKLVIDSPGEYEIADVSITGIPAQRHIDESGQNSTMYKIMVNDITAFFTGHIYPELSEEQLESIGAVDVLFIPVGGNGYTLDPIGALKLIKKIEPKIIVPTHYADSGLKYPVPQQSLENALKELSMEPKEKVDKLKVKAADLSDAAQLVVLKRA